MTLSTNPGWPELAFKTWLLAGEASTVMWLRGMRLMMGGPLAHREAHRMVSEKIVANLGLMPALMLGGAFLTPERASARTLDHYGKSVRANRKRLTRQSG